MMEDVNPNFWPGYPWMELAQHYDVWMPMSYWTNRRGGWSDARAYTAENIARVRQRIGQPDAPVHTIGGIGDRTTVADLQGMVAAATEQGAIGGSIYDYRTTDPSFWGVLRLVPLGVSQRRRSAGCGSGVHSPAPLDQLDEQPVRASRPPAR